LLGDWSQGCVKVRMARYTINALMKSL